MEAAADIRTFVLDFLAEIGAETRETDGIITAAFPPGYKRRFGRERAFTFDPERRRDQVELVEAGSPFLKLLLAEAAQWGGVGAYPTEELPRGTRVYTFQFEAFSSARKRTGFAWAALAPGGDVAVNAGTPPFLGARPEPAAGPVDLRSLREGLEKVLPAVDRAGREFGQDAVRESHEGYAKAMERVHQYFQGMHQDTFLEEARIRKRLGEIQSKLYFTEDGLRELKLQKEQERLTQDLHTLKKRNTEVTGTLAEERQRHVDTQRRRHEPKLRIRLLSAVVAVGAPGPDARAPSARGEAVGNAGSGNSDQQGTGPEATP